MLNYQLEKFYIRRSLQIAVSLFVIWAVTKFGSPLLALPFWLFLFLFLKGNPVAILAIIVSSEAFIGIDSPVIGPFSVIQLLGLILIFSNIKHIRNSYLKDSIFLIILIIAIYFTISYFLFFKKLILGPLDWVFMFLLVFSVFSKNDNYRNLIFIFKVFVVSVFIALVVNFLILIILGDENVFYNEFGFGNPRQISFYGVLILPMVNFLIFQSKVRSEKTFLKLIFYLSIFFTVLSNSRLNTVIVIIYMLYILLNKGNFSAINKEIKKLVIPLILLYVIISFGFKDSSGQYFSRGANFNYINFSNIHSLNDLVNFLDDPNLASITSGRSVVYRDAIFLIMKKPVFGNGFLSWNSKLNNYNTFVTGNTGSRISMHSTIIQYLAETGLIGLFLYLLYLFALYKRGRMFIGSNKTITVSLGYVFMWTSLIMLLGSTFDNHSLSYLILHFMAAIGVFYKPFIKN